MILVKAVCPSVPTEQQLTIIRIDVPKYAIMVSLWNRKFVKIRVPKDCLPII
jgi:hypothetical protein